jgi:hypothetical protein
MGVDLLTCIYFIHLHAWLTNPVCLALSGWKNGTVCIRQQFNQSLTQSIKPISYGEEKWNTSRWLANLMMTMMMMMADE